MGDEGSDKKLSGWEARFDLKSMKNYWKNLLTGEKTWKDPSDTPGDDLSDKTAPTASPTKLKEIKQMVVIESNVNDNDNKDGNGVDEEKVSRWEERFDTKSGKRYWKNLDTSEKTWKNPYGVSNDVKTGTTQSNSASLVSSSSSSSSQGRRASMPSTQSFSTLQGAPQGKEVGTGDWEQKVDPKSGRKYWKNISTGIRTWKNPQSVDDSNDAEATILDGPQPSLSPSRGGMSGSLSTSPASQSAKVYPNAANLEKFLAASDRGRSPSSPSRSRLRSSSLTSLERNSRTLAVHRSGPIMNIDDFKKLQECSPDDSSDYSPVSKATHPSFTSPAPSTRRKSREVRLSSSLASSPECLSPSIIRNKGWNSGFRNAKSLSGPPTKHVPKSFLYNPNAITSISQER